MSMEATSGDASLPIEDRAYQLHCQGYSYRAIARELGIDKDTAQRYVRAIQRELAPQHRANVKRWMAEAVERLHAVQRAAWNVHDGSQFGDVGALNTIAACEEKIARLRGLFAAETTAPAALTVKVEFVNDWRKAHGG
jgi:transposase-like protein